jgi:ribonuclease BN (tRNA processing enzyme)
MVMIVYPLVVKQTMIQVIALTLIYGKQDAVVLDVFITIKQDDDLVNWVVASGKNLSIIFITHSHGDHRFGIGSRMIPKCQSNCDLRL